MALSVTSRVDELIKFSEYGRDLTWGAVWKHTVAKFPDNVAMIDRRTNYTYRETDALIDKISHVLATEYNLTKGDRVIFYGAQRSELFITQTACALLGIVFIIMYPHVEMTGAKTREKMDELEPQLIIFDRPADRACRKWDMEFPCPSWRIYDTNPIFQSLPMDEYPLYTNYPEVYPSDPLKIEYTSGSTGRRKAVIHSHGGFCHCFFEFSDDETSGVYIDLGIYSDCTYTNYMLLAFLSNGGTVVFGPLYWKGNVKEVLGMIKRYNGTATVLLDFCLVAENVTSHCSTLKYMYFCGMKLPVPTIQKFQNIFGPQVMLINQYGTTENGTITRMEIKHGMTVDDGIDSVGRTLIGVDVKIGDGDEILVRGTNSFLGYLDKTRPTFDEEGWFHSHDIGWFDDAGLLHVDGRQGEEFNTVGCAKCFPGELEAKLLRTNMVLEAAVVPWSESDLAGSFPIGFVTRNPETFKGKKAILEAMRWDEKYDCSVDAVIPCVFVEDNLPRRNDIKVDKTALQERLKTEPYLTELHKMLKLLEKWSNFTIR